MTNSIPFESACDSIGRRRSLSRFLRLLGASPALRLYLGIGITGARMAPASDAFFARYDELVESGRALPRTDAALRAMVA